MMIMILITMNTHVHFGYISSCISHLNHMLIYPSTSFRLDIWQLCVLSDKLLIRVEELYPDSMCGLNQISTKMFKSTTHLDFIHYSSFHCGQKAQSTFYLTIKLSPKGICLVKFGQLWVLVKNEGAGFWVGAAYWLAPYRFTILNSLICRR